MDSWHRKTGYQNESYVVANAERGHSMGRLTFSHKRYNNNRSYGPIGEKWIGRLSKIHNK